MNKLKEFKQESIIRQTTKLVKIDEALKNLLAKIDTCMNPLKVDELQLTSKLKELNSKKSNEMPTTSAQAAAINVSATTISWTNSLPEPDEGSDSESFIIAVNKQIIDLESLVVPIDKRKYSDTMEEEEEEEEEEDEDDYDDVSVGDNDVAMDIKNSNESDSDTHDKELREFELKNY